MNRSPMDHRSELLLGTEALERLGKTPSAVAGRGNRIASFFMHRVLPRRVAVELMGRATRARYSK